MVIDMIMCAHRQWHFVNSNLKPFVRVFPESVKIRSETFPMVVQAMPQTFVSIPAPEGTGEIMVTLFFFHFSFSIIKLSKNILMGKPDPFLIFLILL